MMRDFAEACILWILLNVINTLLHQLNQTKPNRSTCYISKFFLQGILFARSFRYDLGQDTLL